MTASATGSQISHYAFDADRVILVCGTQKLVRDEREGMRRIEDYCLPLESERTKKAYGVPATLATILTARIDYPAKRTSIILVTQELGF
jgi:hypothetical protein